MYSVQEITLIKLHFGTAAQLRAFSLIYEVEISYCINLHISRYVTGYSEVSVELDYSFSTVVLKKH